MNKFLFSFLVVLTTGLMGSSFAVGKIGMDYISPLLLIALRFTIAGLLMAVFVLAAKRPHPQRLKEWSKVALIGSFQTAIVMGCIFLSLRTITAGESSILTFTNPLLVVLFGTVFLKARYHMTQWIGVCLGFIGVFITMGSHLDIKEGTYLGMASAVAWAIATLLINTWGREFDTWVLTAYQMLFGGVLLFAASFILEQQVFIVNQTSILIVLWLAIMASIVQFAGWFTLLRIGDPGKVSAFLFLAPFFGVLTGWLLLNETVEWAVLGGGLLIFAGIFLVNWTSKLGKQQLENETQASLQD
ncbi:drug/metabolite transporter (DMT)-like permease [Bacillus ectoiniformans]|uniref:DMT family transporter n=1 Tax=Bacillus ectoiniformans TaxID=1494429 RepID=UPI00195D0F8D|nr:DMT family transporter [Bacillus ectoiniformans]MBM7649829.1 drug/metabolite transporter (DMT)-like permease [Bacillus ectoiniformans]